MPTNNHTPQQERAGDDVLVPRELLDEAAEHVRHAPWCDSIKGGTDEDCECGVIDYLNRLEAASNRRPASPQPQDGWVMVPRTIRVDATTWSDAACAFGGHENGYMDATLIVGESTTDDGSKVHGLHLYCDDYPDEGLITIAEFAAVSIPQPPSALVGKLEALAKNLDEVRPSSPLGWTHQSGVNLGCTYAAEAIRALIAAEKGTAL